jgi:hypothetical protein
MLTLCTLLPSDNEAPLGHSERLYAPLLRPSDNKPILLERSYALHYIECAFNILPKYILYYHIIPYDNIPSDNIWYDKVLKSGSILYACETPPYPKI